MNHTFIVDTSDKVVSNIDTYPWSSWLALHDYRNNEYYSINDINRPSDCRLVPVNLFEWACLEVGAETEETEMTELMLSIDSKLWALGYRVQERSEIIEHVGIYDTTENCPIFRDEDHRRLIESMLPDVWSDFLSDLSSPWTLTNQGGLHGEIGCCRET